MVDTATCWSPFGQAVLLVLMQVGGLGILTSASLLLLLVSRRLGLRRLLVAQAESNVLALGDVRRVVLGVLAISAVAEGLTTAALTLRLWLGHDRSFGQALWQGLFHAVSAFNNVGMSLYSDNLIGFSGDIWFLLPVSAAIIAGLGVPVWLELRRLPRAPTRCSLHVKLTLVTSAVLLVVGGVAITALEWANPDTLGGFGGPVRVMNGFFSSVVARSAGFNTFDVGRLDPDALSVMDGLMFIGGGSGSVAGGIKVATFALLALVVWAELRGEPDVSAFGRTVPPAARADGAVQGRRRGRRHGRQGLRRRGHPAGAGHHSPLGGPRRRRDRRPGGDERHRVLAPALRGHVGVRHADLPAGGTPLLDDAGRAILIALMFIGRVGPVALGAALLLRERPRLYAYPEERPLIG